MLEAIRFSRESVPTSLSILDQLRLPHRSEYVSILSCEDAFDAIVTMKVRGAPAIAIVAALSVAVELSHQTSRSASEQVEFIKSRLAYLASSRPTAVNLSAAVSSLSSVVDSVVAQSSASNAGLLTGLDVAQVYCDAAEQMLLDDVATNRAIGKNGAEWLLQSCSSPVRVLTHCNTGSLATAGYGTALGMIRYLHEHQNLAHAFCTETRPYNQGSRLTSYELQQEGMPATLITDSMAGALLAKSQREKSPINAIIVGADRVAANGDTANKIGTYSLAVLAKHHLGTKFIVAAPWTTIDLSTASGNDIVIEERSKDEVITVCGPRVGSEGTDFVRIALAAPDMPTWNPSFDVTPADLIDAIVTEKGVIERDENGKFDLKRSLRALS